MRYIGMSGHDASGLRPTLSQREANVLRQLALGRTDRHIADQYQISLKTVNHHVANILTKLGAQNRAHAVAKSMHAGLIRLRATDLAPGLADSRPQPAHERRRNNPPG